MNKYYTLKNGLQMPYIGYGTYKCTDGSDERIVRTALEVGYRLLDTAAAYGNEEQVGAAIRASGIPRSEIFLTSKVWKSELGYERTKASLEASLQRLGTDYLDLFLLHWPKPEPDSPDWKELDISSWRALEEAYEEGKLRAIGVSNFLPYHLNHILENARIRPMIDQLELHLGYMQAGAVRYCKERGIAVQAWSPLGRRRALTNPIVERMAQRYQVLPAQFLLRYLLQQDILVIPKSSSAERMRQNLELPDFTIEWEDVLMLNGLPQMSWSGEHPDLERVPAQD